MRIIKIVLLFCLLVSANANASFYVKSDPDSAKFKWINGNKFLLHQVKAKETWSAVARKYNVDVNDIMISNAGVTDLKVGQIINVPASKGIEKNVSGIKPEPPQSGSKYKTAILYTVHNSETLYSISKKYNVTVEDIKKWNALESNILSEGQKLVVNYMYNYEKPVAKETKTISTKPDTKQNEIKQVTNPNVLVEPKEEKINLEKRPATTHPDFKTELPKQNSSEIKRDNNDSTSSRSVVKLSSKNSGGKSLMQVTESGVCTWINDGDFSQTKFYALHRTAPVGTIIKVTNKMNNKSVFVKVVGVLPDTGDNDKSIIKISQATVSKLGALDAHFQVELSYGVMQ